MLQALMHSCRPRDNSTPTPVLIHPGYLVKIVLPPSSPSRRAIHKQPLLPLWIVILPTLYFSFIFCSASADLPLSLCSTTNSAPLR